MPEALDSMIDQTLRSFELLIVDDGSTDRSAAIAADFARRDHRVRVITRDHCGIAKTLNAGLREARGHYIARMDSDDISLPCRLTTQVTYLDRHPDCVVVGCDARVIDEEREYLCTLRFPREHRDIAHDLIEALTVPFAHPGVMMRKAALIACGGYDQDKFPSEDLDLWFRLLQRGKSANIPESLIIYRRHKNSVGARQADDQFRNIGSITNMARARLGLSLLRWGTRPSSPTSATAYHNGCARLAIRGGRRRQVFRHVLACIAAAPLWPEPYVALLACLPPAQITAFLLRYRKRKRNMF